MQGVERRGPRSTCRAQEGARRGPSRGTRRGGPRRGPSRGARRGPCHTSSQASRGPRSGGGGGGVLPTTGFSSLNRKASRIKPHLLMTATLWTLPLAQKHWGLRAAAPFKGHHLLRSRGPAHGGGFCLTAWVVAGDCVATPPSGCAAPQGSTSSPPTPPPGKLRGWGGSSRSRAAEACKQECAWRGSVP